MVAAELDGPEQVGWFTGAVTHKAVRVPAPDAGLDHFGQGCNLGDGVDSATVLAALPRFASGELRCLHLDVSSRWAAASGTTRPCSPTRR